jgi:predicted RNA-binding Zn-ribbon protein involved in translation (DUF1610 family)
MTTNLRAAAEPSPLRCPACGVPLRLRDKRFVGATFPCPACDEKLALVSAEQDRWVLQLAATVAPPPSAKPRRLKAWQLPNVSPLVVAWSVAGLMGVVLVAALWRQASVPPASPPSTGVRPQLAQADAAAELGASPNAADATPPTQLSTAPPKVHPAAELTETTTPDVSPALVSTSAASSANELPPAASRPSESPLATQPLDEAPVSAHSVSLPQTDAPPAPPVPPKVPVEVLLNQRLVSFQQSQPISRKRLLATVEDLLDRPIRVADDVPMEMADRLQTAITLQLEQVTVADLLRAILEGTQLVAACVGDEVQLRAAKP